MKKRRDEDDNANTEWKGRIRRMKDYQRSNSKTWKRNEGLLWGSTGDSDTQQNTIDYAWGLIKSLETSIYVQNPEMAAEAYDSSRMELAKILTALSNYDVDQMDLKYIGNIGLVDNFTSGYFACIETCETAKRNVKEEDGTEMTAVDDQGYEARRIAPKDLLVPICTKIDLSDAPYCASYFYPTVTELKNDKEQYPDLPDDIEDFPEATHESRTQGPESAKAGAVRGGQQKEKDPDFKTIAMLEVWDRVNRKCFYVTDHKAKTVGSRPWPVEFNIGRRKLYPITIMAFHPLPNRFYAKPELDLIAPQLILLNQIDRIIYQDATTKWRKYVTFSKMMASDQQAKITDTSVENAVISIDESAIDDLAGTQNHQIPNLRELVVPLEDPSPKKDLFAVRDMLKQEITDIIGYGPPDRGGMPKTRSAREAVAIKEKLEARLAKRADAVADFYRMFGMKHIMFLQQTMEIERYARVFQAAKGLAEFVKYDREAISGEFNFIVYAGTSAPRSTEAKRNMEMEIFKILWPVAQAGQIPLEPVLMRLAEALQWKGVDALLRNPKPTAKQMLLKLIEMGKGKLQPNEIPNLAAALVKQILTPEEMKMTVQEAEGGEGGAPPEEAAGKRGDPGGLAAERGAM